MEKQNQDQIMNQYLKNLPHDFAVFSVQNSIFSHNKVNSTLISQRRVYTNGMHSK